MRKPAPRPAAVAAMLFLALSSCGGPAHSDQASAPAAQSAAAPIASGAAATPTGVPASAGASAGSAGAPAGSAGAKAPSATKGGAASAAPVPGPVPLDLDKSAVYEDWNFGQASAGAIWLEIKDSSCNDFPNTSVTETATSVTILVIAQLLRDGDPTCKSVPKTVGMLASIMAPLGNRFLEGCRPARENAGQKFNCRTGAPWKQHGSVRDGEPPGSVANARRKNAANGITAAGNISPVS